MKACQNVGKPNVKLTFWLGMMYDVPAGNNQPFTSTDALVDLSQTFFCCREFCEQRDCCKEVS